MDGRGGSGGEGERRVPHPIPGEVPRRPGGAAERPAPPPGGGEAGGPARRLLDRPPGDRFRVGEPEPPATSPALGRAFAFALAGWIGVVLAWLILAGIVGLDWGMLVVAVAGGWLVGTLGSTGAWAGRPHVPRPSPRLLAALVAASAWLGGQAAVYLWTRVTLPESSLDVGARIAALPFADYLAGVIGPLDAIELALLAAIAWAAAR